MRERCRHRPNVACEYDAPPRLNREPEQDRRARDRAVSPNPYTKQSRRRRRPLERRPQRPDRRCPTFAGPRLRRSRQRQVAHVEGFRTATPTYTVLRRGVRRTQSGRRQYGARPPRPLARPGLRLGRQATKRSRPLLVVGGKYRQLTVRHRSHDTGRGSRHRRTSDRELR